MGKPNVSEAIAAIKKSRGFVSKAAADCNTSRTTFHKMINEHPTLREAVEDAREANKDFVENKLMTAINNDNITAIIFYLKTQAKDRGYVEKQELQHSGEVTAPVQVVEVVRPAADE